MRMPVARSTSTAAQAQNACSSSRHRSRRLPVVGSSSPDLAEPPSGAVTERTRVCPAAVKASPGRPGWPRLEEGRGSDRAAVDAADEDGQDGQPFAGAGVHAGLAPALGLASG